MAEEHILDEEQSRILRGLVRPARRIVLAMAQTTNPKRRAKLATQLERLKEGRK